MKEDQNTEFKEAWHDEYTRYISAFCNTQGDKLLIGINDKGQVCGLDHPEKLLEKLPKVDKALDVLRTKYLLSFISYEGIHRREKLVYPYDALREAILNAVIHREYFPSSEIHIRVYDDKLVISNEARLQDITVEDLSRSHPSRPHNKLIADVFYKAGFIESWGRGTQRIIEYCLAEDLPAPVFEWKMGCLYLTFVNERVNERVNELSETENIVLLAISRAPNITQRALAHELNMTEQYIRKIMKGLKDKEVIKRIGSDKTGFWHVQDLLK